MIYSKLKRGLLCVAVASMLQIPMASMLYAQESNNSESSMILTSVAIIGISMMPIILPATISGQSADSSERDQDEDFVYIDAQDEAGKPVQLRLPKTAKDKVEIQPTDKIAMKVGVDGDRTLYVNGVAKNIFIQTKDAEILQQKPLN